MAISGATALVLGSVLVNLVTKDGWEGMREHWMRSTILLVIAVGAAILAIVVGQQ